MHLHRGTNRFSIKHHILCDIYDSNLLFQRRGSNTHRARLILRFAVTCRGVGDATKVARAYPPTYTHTHTINHILPHLLIGLTTEKSHKTDRADRVAELDQLRGLEVYVMWMCRRRGRANSRRRVGVVCGASVWNMAAVRWGARFTSVGSMHASSVSW
jgi:hypothetical protein